MRLLVLLCVVCAVLGEGNFSFFLQNVSEAGTNDVTIHVHPGPNPAPVQHEVSIILQSLQRLFAGFWSKKQDDDHELIHA